MIISGFISILAATSVLFKMAKTNTRVSPLTTKSPAKKGSPRKKDISSIKLSKLKLMWHPNYTFKIIKLKANIKVIWCEKSPCDDAFLHPLIHEIEDNDGFHEHGIIGISHHWAGHHDNMLLFNSADGYPHHLILCVVDESTHKSHMGILMILREFMMRPENNWYSYEYIINKTSDLTLANEQQLEPANAYILDYSVINIIMAIFETADENWYIDNIEITNDYFVDQPYPCSAIDQLGFPETGSAFHPGFNLPTNAWCSSLLNFKIVQPKTISKLLPNYIHC